MVPAEVETIDEMYNHILDMIAEGGSLDNVDTCLLYTSRCV